MPAYLADRDVAALKWVAGYPSNKERGLPYISGLIVVNDAETGLPLAVMDGAEITAARTAAASGVCLRRFAPEGWSRVGVLGAGEQARFHLRVIEHLGSEPRVHVYDPHPERVAALGRVTPAADEADAVREADVVVTAGPIVAGPEPMLGPEHLGPRWLALPIDFDFALRPETVAAADLVLADDVAQFQHYRGLGHFQGWPEPHGSVGERLGDGVRPKRVVCVNLGIGALDAAFAARVLAAARERGAGTGLAR